MKSLVSQTVPKIVCRMTHMLSCLYAACSLMCELKSSNRNI